jgi:cell wall-associated NlpC family hydrolase
MKKFFIVIAIASISTTSSAAFASISNSRSLEEVNSNRASQQVTKTAPKIVNPIQEVNLLSGPTKISDFLSGPVIASTEPEVGSMEWMTQEKAERDKLESDAERKQAELEAKIAVLEKIAKDTKNLNKAVAKTKSYAGKTWYVLSGSTPDAWDCSGLVMWTYGNLNITLEHSASIQKNSGKIVTEPKIGDIVSFTYRGSNNAFHTGIYIGPDEMVHAGGKRGDRTEIVSISKWAKGNAKAEVTFTRIVETNN